MLKKARKSKNKHRTSPAGRTKELIDDVEVQPKITIKDIQSMLYDKLQKEEVTRIPEYEKAIRSLRKCQLKEVYSTQGLTTADLQDILLKKVRNKDRALKYL